MKGEKIDLTINQSLIDRYETLRSSFIQQGAINMEQKYFMKKGMLSWIKAWSTELSLTSVVSSKNTCKEQFLKPEPEKDNSNNILNNIITSLILSNIRN